MKPDETTPNKIGQFLREPVATLPAVCVECKHERFGEGDVCTYIPDPASGIICGHRCHRYGVFAPGAGGEPAQTLSEDETKVLLSGNIKRLQSMITTALTEARRAGTPTTDARAGLMKLHDEVVGYFAWRLGPDSKGKHRDIPDEAVKAVNELCQRIASTLLPTPSDGAQTWGIMSSTCQFCGRKVQHVCTAFLKGDAPKIAPPEPPDCGGSTNDRRR